MHTAPSGGFFTSSYHYAADTSGASVGWKFLDSPANSNHGEIGVHVPSGGASWFEPYYVNDDVTVDTVCRCCVHGWNKSAETTQMGGTWNRVLDGGATYTAGLDASGTRVAFDTARAYS